MDCRRHGVLDEPGEQARAADIAAPVADPASTTQFGTLGSGNHFVEVCEDTDGSVWLLLHSGSRGIGNMLATAHVYVAKSFCERNGIAVEDRDSRT